MAQMKKPASIAQSRLLALENYVSDTSDYSSSLIKSCRADGEKSSSSNSKIYSMSHNIINRQHRSGGSSYLSVMSAD